MFETCRREPRRCLFLGLILFAVTACGLPWQSPAAETEAEVRAKLDALFDQYDHWDTPGLALGVLRDGELYYARGYGCANLEYGIPITPSTVFHVASVSKQFTCFAIALLAAEGKLSLDDNVRKHLADLPDLGQPITLRQLMHHTSGIRDQWELLAMAGWRLDDVITREHILKMMRRQRDLNFPPGSEHLYCNMGYTLLGEVVARVSGKSFPEFTEERIFKPLGMAHTHFHDDHERIVPNRAYSYAKRDSGFRKRVLSYANVGATSLFTTVEDMAWWLANFESGTVGGSQLLETMQTKGVLTDGKKINYALGLSHGNYRGQNTVGHGGADAGFRSHVVRFPEHRLGIVILGNLSELDAQGAAMKVADVLLAEHLDPVERKDDSIERIKLSIEVLKEYVGTYRLDSGAMAELAVREDRLMAKIPGNDEVELVPTAPTKFFIKELGAHVTFTEPKAEDKMSLTVEVGDTTIKGHRTTDVDAPDLPAFVGRYYSPELDTAYTIAIDGDHLVATHQRHDDIKLAYTGDDGFAGDEWFFGRVQFDRDAGKVVGFRVTGGRVRNLRFERR
jgi:CubicO group peptidase (beta-lactamase class C family)